MTTEALLDRARGGDEEAFRALTDPYRRELHVHCYRILGSVQDAEDVMQETLLAAWRGLAGFEERASLRAWLYRIATNRSLNARRDSARRPSASSALPFEPPPPTRMAEPLWLEPYPDALLDELPDAAAGPDARYETKEAVGLAFVTGLQHMAPRQRAVLVLRDVLGFRAAEVADTLGVTEAAVTSALFRARSELDAGPSERAPLPDSPEERALVDRFTNAFEGGDIDGVVALLAADARLTMPPTPLEYEGPVAIGRFLSAVPAGGRLEMFRLVPTRANGQPAFGCYQRDPQAAIAHAYGLMVLTLRDDRIAAITGFPDTSVFAAFGLRRTLTDA
jgi:RNA polymerase sigma-70 factor (TIGR02960 family)